MAQVGLKSYPFRDVVYISLRTWGLGFAAWGLGFGLGGFEYELEGSS